LTKSSVQGALPGRKKQFLVALAHQGMSGADFATLMGVSRQALNAVLNGRGRSQRLEEAIDRFISATAKKLEAA
jgi:hypothetical protein